MFWGDTGSGGGEDPGEHWVGLVGITDREQHMYVDPVPALSRQSKKHSSLGIIDKHIKRITNGSSTSDDPMLKEAKS